MPLGLSYELPQFPCDGFVLRDFFQQDYGSWLQDPVLLERLVGEN